MLGDCVLSFQLTQCQLRILELLFKPGDFVARKHGLRLLFLAGGEVALRLLVDQQLHNTGEDLLKSDLTDHRSISRLLVLLANHVLRLLQDRQAERWQLRARLHGRALIQVQHQRLVALVLHDRLRPEQLSSDPGPASCRAALIDLERLLTRWRLTRQVGAGELL